mmetsp:Transcript_30510/g.55339  ORF Transcript_30510/g.55339 Transcript_30510/m.55339 type:complete len:102 (+) Transcript_30510:652-957(+)
MILRAGERFASFDTRPEYKGIDVAMRERAKWKFSYTANKMLQSWESLLLLCKCLGMFALKATYYWRESRCQLSPVVDIIGNSLESDRIKCNSRANQVLARL